MDALACSNLTGLLHHTAIGLLGNRVTTAKNVQRTQAVQQMRLSGQLLLALGQPLLNQAGKLFFQ